jgi:hypothetical protein
MYMAGYFLGYLRGRTFVSRGIVYLFHGEAAADGQGLIVVIVVQTNRESKECVHLCYMM